MSWRYYLGLIGELFPVECFLVFYPYCENDYGQRYFITTHAHLRTDL